MTTFKPRDYQKRALDELTDAYHKNETACVVSPTGSGKTPIIRMFCEYLLTNEPELRICLTVHRLEILQNLRDSLKGLNVEFQTIQKLNRSPNLKYDVLIIDEAHHVPAKSYRKVLKTNATLHYGFTATPLRGYMPELPDFLETGVDDWKFTLTGLVNDELFQRFILTIDTKELIRQGYLSDYEIIHDFDFHIKHLGSNGTDYTKSEIDNAISPLEACDYVKQTIESKKAIIFCHSIEFADELGRLLGKQSVVITSNTSKSERETFFEAFKYGTIQILIGVDIFNEGVDVPNTDCVYLFRPTRSIPVYFQQVGRALRLAEGKEKAIVYDYVNNRKRLGTEPKLVKLADMLLLGKFIKEECELCGAYGTISGTVSRKCRSVPNETITQITRWLGNQENKWELKYNHRGNRISFELIPSMEFSNEEILEYVSILYGKQFPTYIMPTIMNQYGRWELATPQNIGKALKSKQSRCFEMVGGCKYSDAKHPYFVISDNLIKRDTKKIAKIKT